MRYALVLAVALLASCTTYYHEETIDAEGNILHWQTSIRRTWGTSNAEFYVTTQSERGSIGGNGISSNMSDVLGDDAIGKIVTGVTGRTQPQPVIVYQQPMFLPDEQSQ